MLSKYFIAPRRKKSNTVYFTWYVPTFDRKNRWSWKTVNLNSNPKAIQKLRLFDWHSDKRTILSPDFFLESFDLIADQLRSTYEMTLSRSWMNETVQSEKVIKSVPELLQLNVYVFHYIILRGIYRIEFRLCDIDTDDLDYGCDQKTISSGKVPVMTSLPGLESSWCLQV